MCGLNRVKPIYRSVRHKETMIPTHYVHNIPFIREGKCLHCGLCEKKYPCPHLLSDGVTCSVHATKQKVCKECTNNPDSRWYDRGTPVTHQFCADFPVHPWLRIIKNKQCGFTFTRLDEDGNISSDPLPDYERI